MDVPTNLVLDWFRYLNFKDFIRINGTDFSFSEKFTININDRIIHSPSIKVDLQEIKAVFYRRWSTNVDQTPLHKEYLEKNYSVSDVRLVKDFANHFISEVNTYNRAIFALQEVDHDAWIPNYKKVRELNKLEILKIANKNGLKIPKTIITSDKTSLKEFFVKYKNIITKPISEVTFIDYEGVQIEMLTKKVTDDNISQLPDVFFPTLFQTMINKDFELRIFYLEGEFYSMAIFSQNDKTTEIDFRNYNVNKPNRYVPFSLPKKLQNQLHEMMKEIGLNTGSIDMIYDNEGSFVFLEVNPVGQLGMVSENCNYNLERIIAESLIKRNNGS